MDEISDHAKNLTLSEDLERTVEERVNILFDFVKVNILFVCLVAALLQSYKVLVRRLRASCLGLYQSTCSTDGGKASGGNRALTQTSVALKCFSVPVL